MNKLAVLIPVFNDQNGLELTLKALTTCSEKVDVWIVDDGSTNPVEVPRIDGLVTFLIRIPNNRGIVEALNTGLAQILSTGYKYIARLDAGDIPLKSRLESQLHLLESNPKIGLVGVRTEFVTPQGELLYVWMPPHESRKLRRFMHMQNAFVHSSVMYTATAISEVGGYRDKYPGAEDFDLFWRIMQKYDIAMIPKVLMRCELNPKGLSLRKRRQQLSSIMALRLKYFDPYIKESYLGIFRGLLSAILPIGFVNLLKHLFWRRKIEKLSEIT